MTDFLGSNGKKIWGFTKKAAAAGYGQGKAYLKQKAEERKQQAEAKKKAEAEARANRDTRSHNERYFDNVMEGLPPIKAELLEVAPLLDSGRGRGISAAIQAGDDRMLQERYLEALGMASPEDKKRLLNVGKRSGWANFKQIFEGGYFGADNHPDAIDLGQAIGADKEGGWIRFTGEGHLLTVAPTRAGKGQAHIIPTLLEHKSCVVVLDPKGENYKETAAARRGFGKVFKWAPFDEVTDCFNPLNLVRSYEDAVEFADLAIVSANRADPFWDDSAREILAGFVHYVKTVRPFEKQNMREVVRLVYLSQRKRKELIAELQNSDDDHLSDLGNTLEDQSENLQGSVFQTLKAHVKIWRTDKVARATSHTSDDFTPAITPALLASHDQLINMGAMSTVGYAIEEHTNEAGETGGVWKREGLESYFFVIPPERIATYAPVLRVVLGMIINSAQQHARDAENNEGDSEVENPIRRSTLFILDELPQLGYMRIIENAMAIAGSARIRFWLFAQDLNQLEVTYPKARSMIANCKMQMFFAPGDMETAEMISSRVGEFENITGSKQRVVTPQELMGTEFQNQQVIFARGVPPIRAHLRYAYSCPYVENVRETVAAHGMDKWPDRRNLDGRLFEFNEPEKPSKKPQVEQEEPNEIEESVEPEKPSSHRDDENGPPQPPSF